MAKMGGKRRRSVTEFDWKVEKIAPLRRHFSGKQNIQVAVFMLLRPGYELAFILVPSHIPSFF